MHFYIIFFFVALQAQVQRSLDSSIPTQPRALIRRRSRREVSAVTGVDDDTQGGSPKSEQDSGILDVEEEEEEDEVRRKLFIHTKTT